MRGESADSEGAFSPQGFLLPSLPPPSPSLSLLILVSV